MAADKAADKAPAADPVVEKAADKPSDKPAAKTEPAPAAKTSDEYVVKPGDSLGKIAKEFYGDARRYDVIVKANPKLEANPNLLKVGTKLVIPKI